MMDIPNPADGNDINATNPEPGQVWRTALGERVEIIGYSDTERTLKLRFPEREPQLDEGGERREEHIQFQSRYSFADAANFERYELVSVDGADSEDDEDSGTENMDGEFEGTPRCPVCDKFMSTGYDGMGHPSAQCSGTDCHGFMDDRELIDRGFFVEN